MYVLLLDLVCVLNSSKEELLTILLSVGMVLLWCRHGVTTRCSNYLSNCVCTKCGLGWYSDVNSCIRVKWKTGSLWTVYCVCCCYGVDTRLSKY